MLNVLARVQVGRVTEPIGRWLVGHGVAPDVVTVVGTVGTVGAALWFLPRGQLFVGALVITLFVLFDLVDGAMARARGRGTPFGAVLDSTCDRVADGALFAGLTWWCLGVGEQRTLGIAALLCLVAGQLVSYIKARAEGEGLSADGGLVERAERLIIALVGTALHGLGVPYALDVALWVLAAASLWTVGQRIVAVHRAARAAAGSEAAVTSGPLSPGPSRRLGPRRSGSVPESSVTAPPSPSPPSLAGQFGERLADVEYAAGWRLARTLPPGLVHAAFRLGADVAARRAGPGARRLRANLARVVPDARPAELDLLVRAGLRSYARYWCEAFRLPAMDPAAVHAATEVTGSEPFLAALDAGRGVVFALPHSGNWDAAGVWLVETLRGRGRDPAFTTVAQRLRPESLYRRFVAYRQSLGFEVVAGEDGAAAYRALTRRCGRGGVVCLVADRDLTATGVEVSLLRRTGSAARRDRPGSPPLTGSLLLPGRPGLHGRRVDACRSRIRCQWPGGRHAAADATQAVADAFGLLIARAPADWHALQPIWTADRRRAAVPG